MGHSTWVYPIPAPRCIPPRPWWCAAAGSVALGPQSPRLDTTSLEPQIGRAIRGRRQPSPEPLVRLIIVPLGLVAVALCGTACSSGNSDFVSNPVISTLTVSPHESSVAVGGSTQLTATAVDTDGNEFACTVTWTSSAPGVATVSSSGSVTGVAAGSASIKASCLDRDDSAAITVTPAPALHHP